VLSDYQTLVDNLVRDDESRISTTTRDNAISLAVSRYSQDRPREAVEDVAADGTRLLPLPTAWVTDFSRLRQVEYPIGNTPPTLLADTAFYRSPAALKLLLAQSIPNAALVRVTFTIRHTLDASTDTIPVEDREPVSAYAAALLCDQLASLYSGDTDSTIAADNVDHQSKAREFAARARALRSRYFDALGVEPKRNVAAGVVVDLDLPSSQGRGRLTHPERWR